MAVSGRKQPTISDFPPGKITNSHKEFGPSHWTHASSAAAHNMPLAERPNYGGECKSLEGF
jgi:hypothetical protein